VIKVYEPLGAAVGEMLIAAPLVRTETLPVTAIVSLPVPASNIKLAGKTPVAAVPKVNPVAEPLLMFSVPAEPSTMLSVAPLVIETLADPDPMVTEAEPGVAASVAPDATVTAVLPRPEEEGIASVPAFTLVVPE
jgi:hypothetical protein